MDGTQHNIELNLRNFPLLFEMMRSFATLAATLNVSRAVEELGSTRQTLKRHISQLEDAFGGPLFDIRDRRYELTELGVAVLPDALDILARSKAWLSGQLSARNGLPCLHAHIGEWQFHQQQQPMGKIWNSDDPLLAEVFRAWSLSEGQIEHPAFAHVRPFGIVYRQNEAGWICVEFGERSFYVGWFGADYAKSSIGRPIGKLPIGEEFGRMLDEAFYEVERMQATRLDHIFTLVPYGASGRLRPVAYQRLMMYGRFPDESPAVMSFVLPTRDVDIDGLDPGLLDTLEDLAPIKFEREEIRLIYSAE